MRDKWTINEPNSPQAFFHPDFANGDKPNSNLYDYYNNN